MKVSNLGVFDAERNIGGGTNVEREEDEFSFEPNMIEVFVSCGDNTTERYWSNLSRD